MQILVENLKKSNIKLGIHTQDTWPKCVVDVLYFFKVGLSFIKQTEKNIKKYSINGNVDRGSNYSTLEGEHVAWSTETSSHNTHCVQSTKIATLCPSSIWKAHKIPSMTKTEYSQHFRNDGYLFTHNINGNALLVIC